MKFIMIERAFLNDSVVINSDNIQEIVKDSGDNEGGSIIHFLDGRSYRVKDDFTKLYQRLS